MIVLKSFRNIFNISELRSKILFTLGVLIVYRLGSLIPIIGVNIQLLAEYMKQAATLGKLFSYLDIFSGSSLDRARLFSLGISPNITASIMMQLLSMSVPWLEELRKQGEYGRKKINQYTRYLTLLLSIVYSFSYAWFLEANNLVLYSGWSFKIPFIISMAAGSMFVMWLGEQISLFGIGNGSSMIIFAGIVARFPFYVMKTLNAIEGGSITILTALFILVFFLALMAAIVFIEKGERKIPVQYARRVVGNRVYGGQSTYIPFKMNAVGVMPVIFAGSMLQFPSYIIGMLSGPFPSLRPYMQSLLDPTGVFYSAITFILIMFFTFFYTALIYNPEELAQNMKKSGGFIPGVRPGRRTAQFFDYILTRLGLLGALYLAFLSITPNVLHQFITMPFYLGGTSLLIVVGVAIEVSSQMEGYLLEHRYEGFLTTGKVRG